MSQGLALAFPLALGAALLHALWNVLLKTSHDPLKVSTVAVTSGMIAATPIALVAWLLTGRPSLPATAWALALISSVIELGYFIFLSEAYRRGELSVVYPIARGTAPLLTVPIGLIILQEHLSGLEAVGIVMMLAGIWAVRRPVTAGRAVLPAVLTGLCIATYSSIDRVGVRLTDAWLYGWALGMMTAVILLLWASLREGWTFKDLVQSTPQPLPATAGAQTLVMSTWPTLRAPLVGVLMISSWMMILAALSVAPLSVVSPLRESAIILVTGWGIWRLRERHGMWLRLAGALTIVVGAILLAVQ